VSALLLVACPSDSGGEQGSSGEARKDLPPLLRDLTGAEQAVDQQVSADDWQLPDRGSEPPHPPWLRLFYSQDTRGELDPCGCPGSPSGGMARRTTLVRRLRQLVPESIVVEGPTCLSRAVLGTEVVHGEHRARARLLLRLVAATRPEAFFPGNADFEVVDPVELAALAAELELPLVATNLDRGLASGSYLPYLIVPVAERRVVLLGLVGSADNEGVRARVPTVEAVAAVTAALEEALAEAGRIDMVIAFSDAGIRDLGRWRDRGIDVDVMLTPPVRGEDNAPSWRGDVLELHSEPLGRAFGRLDLVFAPAVARGLVRQPRNEWALRQIASMEELFLDRQQLLERLAEDGPETQGDPATGRIGLDGLPQTAPSRDPAAIRRGLAEAKEMRANAVAALGEMELLGHLAVSTLLLIDPKIAEDGQVKARLEEFHGGQLAKIAAELRAGAPAPVDEEYAGQDACIACHAEKVAGWARGPHARAWLHLSQRGETRNTRCLGCHTTGFGEAGGFVDAQDNSSLLNVQCEGCHGPMRLHARQATRVGIRPSSGLPIGLATCTRCHDEENSPRFDCSSYVQRVGHGDAGESADLVARICGSRPP
jgi:hypothetical protein